MMRILRSTLCTLVGLCLLLTAGSARALDIDDFSDGDFNVVVLTPGTGGGSVAATCLGGVRTYSYAVTAIYNNLAQFQVVTPPVNLSGILTLSSGAGTAFDFSLTYESTILSPFDLSGEESIDINVTYIDINGTFDVTIVDWANATQTVSGIALTGAQPKVYKVALSQFTNVNLHIVQKLTITFHGYELDMDVESITTTTKPGVAALGDFVWNDLNANGIQDTGELGIPNVTVELHKCSDDSLVATTSTDANGLYHFTDLAPGSYYVVFGKPAGYVFSPQDQGNDDAVDSDADPTTGKTVCVTLQSGETNNTIDAGIHAGALGDFVWYDLNANGVQEANEPGVPGVTVNLYKMDGSGNPVLVGTTTTDANGLYLFTGLSAGLYRVEFVKPAGYVFSPPNRGVDLGKDSDANPATGFAPAAVGGWIGLAAGQIDLRWDAGLVLPVTIGDFVWHDLNANGIQDSGEPGIAGVTLTLTGTDSAGVPVTDHATTDGTGHYLFTELQGTYQVTVDAGNFTGGGALVGFAATPTLVGPDRTVDSNPSPSVTTPAALPWGGSDLTLDFGYYQPAAIGDRVWEDTNGNGIQDAGEPGIDGVTVNLHRCSDNSVVATTTTAGGGIYGFSNLAPGDYYVEFVAPGGYVFTTQDAAGSTDGNDSDATPATGKAICTTLTSGETDLTWDAGLYKPASLGDFVWDDLNANGIQDTGEPGISGVTVKLHRCSDDSLVATTITDSNGLYHFTGLTPGSYYVVFVKPAGYAFSPQDEGNDDAVDSDAKQATGQTDCVTLQSGETNNTVDAGLHKTEQPPEITIVKTGKKLCEPAGSPCGECEGKVTQLTLRYNGDKATDIKVVEKDGKVVFENSVQPGGQFSFSGQDKNGTLGTEISIYEGRTLNTTIHTSCSQPIGPGLVRGDFLVVSGESLKGGPLCPLETPPSAGCGECEGKVTQLTLRYNGAKAAVIKVVQKKDGDVVYNKSVQPGGQFSFSGQDKNGTLGTEISIYEGKTLNTTIHTSCSQPIGPGLVKGDFLVVAGASLKGGALCSLDSKSTSGLRGECDDGADGADNDCASTPITVGDSIVYTITVTANLPAAQQVEVVDRLDDCLEFLSADNDGEFVPATHAVVWVLELPAGPSVTTLELKVKLTCLPKGDYGQCPTDAIVCGSSELEVLSECPEDDGHDGNSCGTSGCDGGHHSDRSSGCGSGGGGYTCDSKSGSTSLCGSQSWWGLSCLSKLLSWTWGGCDHNKPPCKPNTVILRNCACVYPYTPPPPPTGGGCTYTLGYWKNHPDAWPVDTITIGGRTYTKKQAIELLGKPPKGDATIILAHQLIAATLNLLNGADPTDVVDAIAAADAWLKDHRVCSDPKGPSREDGIDLSETLDDYNNGAIGPGHCDETECDDDNKPPKSDGCGCGGKDTPSRK